MNPHRLAWGFASTFPFAQVVAVTTLVGTLLTGRWKRPALTTETILLGLFVAWMQVTTLFAFNHGDAWLQWEKVLKIQFMILVTIMLIYTTTHLRNLVWVVVLSLGFYGVKGGIFTVLTGGEHRIGGPDGTFIEGNNEIGLALIMAIPLMRYLHLTSSRRIVQYGLTAAMALCAVSVMGTHSRGALLGIVAMSCFLVWKSKKRLGVAMLVLVVLPFVLAVMPQKWFAWMDTLRNYQEDPSATGRLNAWQFALNLAMDRPIVGGGFETFRPELFAPDK